MNVDIKYEYPPNYSYVRNFFPVAEVKPIFAYGTTLYNPYKLNIPEDVTFHEFVHIRQQRSYESPEIWWSKYCTDRSFRKQQEVEAFAHQYYYVKTYIPSASREALREFATNLSSSLYDLGITYKQAVVLITNCAKTL